jgi:hypothetical protein
MSFFLDTLEGVRADIAADDDVLAEAKARRDLVASAAMKFDGALRWFRSGSVAHGTTNHPVTDADAGLVLDRRIYPELGPNGEGPKAIAEELRSLVGETVRTEYRNARLRLSRRGLLVTFAERLQDDQDPTVDMLWTLTRSDGDGLWIPDLDNNTWSASHPEKHTELFTGGSKSLRATRARVTRLAKAWNKQWAPGSRALSSFNIEALAWEYVEDGTMGLDEALTGWFAYAKDQLTSGKTEDPAGVSDDIKLLLNKDEVLTRLGNAADRLQHALDHEDDEEIVLDDLAGVFRDFVKPPTKSKSALAGALRSGNNGVGIGSSGLVIAGTTPLKTTRSYGEGGQHG